LQAKSLSLTAAKEAAEDKDNNQLVFVLMAAGGLLALIALIKR
jgi:hypothetical protein